MRFEQCPYCQRPVDVVLFPGGWVRISCATCGAQWEAHSGMVRRIADGELLETTDHGDPAREAEAEAVPQAVASPGERGGQG